MRSHIRFIPSSAKCEFEYSVKKGINRLPLLWGTLLYKIEDLSVIGADFFFSQLPLKQLKKLHKGCLSDKGYTIISAANYTNAIQRRQ